MKRTALTIIGWVVSATMLVLLALNMDLRAMFAGLADARLKPLLAAALLNIGVIAVKALRWQLIMNPAHRAGFGEIFKVTMIGLAGNNVLPARGGDWLRIHLLGKWKNASRSMLASITGLDKLFDGLAILVLFGALSFHSTFPEWVQRGTLIVSMVIAVSLAICVLLLIHHGRSLPGMARGRISRLAASLGAGMVVLRRKRLIALTLAVSVATCLMQVATIWLCQEAFGEGLDMWIPAIVYVAINLAIAIPSAPSGVGPFEAAAVLAYTWIGISTERAMNIALAYHAVQFIPVTIIGALLYAFACGVRRPAAAENS